MSALFPLLLYSFKKRFFILLILMFVFRPPVVEEAFWLKTEMKSLSTRGRLER